MAVSFGWVECVSVHQEDCYHGASSFETGCVAAGSRFSARTPITLHVCNLLYEMYPSAPPLCQINQYQNIIDITDMRAAVSNNSGRRTSDHDAHQIIFSVSCGMVP